MLSLLLPLANAQVAYAAPADDYNTDQSVRSYLYFQALGNCFENSILSSGWDNNLIDPADAASGKWFVGSSWTSTARSTAVGSYIERTDGYVKCDNPSWIGSALDLWGYDSKTEFLCDIGMVRDSGPCGADAEGAYIYPGKDSQGYGDEFKDKLGEIVYGRAGNPSLTAEMKYLLFRKTFERGCYARQLVKKSEASSDQQALASSDYGYTLKVVDNSGNISDWYYYGDEENNNEDMEIGRGDYITTATTPNYNLSEYTCNELVREANANAEAYAQLVAVTADDETKPQEKPDSLDTPADGDSNPDVPVCSTGDAGGWIACTVFVGLQKAITGLVTNFVEPLLKVNTFTEDDSRAAVEQVWSRVKDMANIALIIAFMVVIYSQATSMGISAYGIKRLAPRILIAAILINISFFVTGVIVDIFNILGAGIQSVVTSAISGSKLDLGGGGTLLGIGVAGGILGTVAFSTGFAAALWAILPILGFAALAILVFALVLVARLAFINLLIILAPLAIAAMILPGTESWFKKWRQTFGQMLVIYPMMMLLLGSGTLVAVIIQNIPTTNDTAKFIFQALALLAQFLPIFALPIVLQTFAGSLGRVTSALNRVSDKAKGGIRNYSAERRRQASKNYLATPGRPGVFGMSRRFSQRRDLKSRLRDANEQANENVLKSKAQQALGGTNPNLGFGSNRLASKGAEIQEKADLAEAELNVANATIQVNNAERQGTEGTRQFQLGQQLKTANDQKAAFEGVADSAYERNKVNQTGELGRIAHAADQMSRTANQQKASYQARGDANWAEQVAADDHLSTLDMETKAQGIRKQVAEGVQTGSFAREIQQENSHINNTAAGHLEVDAAGNVTTSATPSSSGRIRAAAYGVSQLGKIQSEERSAARTLLEAEGVTSDRAALQRRIQEAGTNGNHALAAAATEALLDTGGTEELYATLSRAEVRSNPEALRTVLEAAKRKFDVIDTKSPDLAEVIGNENAITNIQQSGIESLVADNARAGRLQASKLIAMEPGAAQRQEARISPEQAVAAMQRPDFANAKQGTQEVLRRRAALAGQPTPVPSPGTPGGPPPPPPAPAPGP